MRINFLKDEHWYGGMVDMGVKFPISSDDDISVLFTDYTQGIDQSSPLVFSNKGRYIYGKCAFDAHFKYGEIIIDDNVELEIEDGYETLKDAQLAFAGKHFKLNGTIPNLKFFKTPQYNTWIELMYNQNQKQILEYAHSLSDAGMPAGVLMIDEGWSPDYGIYDFDKAKFDNPKAMIDELHEMGFSVMLWVTPLISPDSNCYRELRDTDIIIKDENGKPAVRSWWNGYSCVLDFTNPKTCEWFGEKLEWLMDNYGIDGFKFDSGDTYLYKEEDNTYIKQEPSAHTKTFDLYCGGYTFNELRNVWDCGGEPLICRLQDKNPSWDDTGLKAIIPNMLTQGILGYYFGCPDMIGGGAYGSFLEKNYKTDEELYLRWLGASILCPMMQFSISPKRILTKKGFETVQQLLAIRDEFIDIIIELSKKASKTGEPVMRYMEYEFPNCGYEKVTDQFMLGSDILVAPILEKGEVKRKIQLPFGKWKSYCGETFDGGCEIEFNAAINEVPIFIKQ